MDSKLTLKLNKEVIEKAKRYAELKKISLSRLVESYLQLLVKEETKKESISPLVESLSGVIDLPADYNEKERYSEYLAEKYKG
jgi:glycine cleavage system pyridoxal-binding protein P